MTDAGDTFGVAIGVTDREFQFLVRVPSDIDAGWTDPDAFQSQIEQVTWDRLDKERTLRAVDRVASPGESVSLGTVRMRPDGTVLDHSLSPPDSDDTDDPVSPPDSDDTDHSTTD